MTLEAIDRGMQNKLDSIFPNVIQLGIEKVLESDQIRRDGKVKLPLISFERISNPISDDYINQAALRRGVIAMDAHTEELTYERSLPVNVTYQLIIWSKSRKQVDGIWGELCMYWSIHPDIEVEFTFDKSNIQITKHFTFKMTDHDSDFDIGQFADEGRLYRQIITLESINARIYFDKDLYLVKDIPIEMVSLESLGITSSEFSDIERFSVKAEDE